VAIMGADSKVSNFGASSSRGPPVNLPVLAHP
jgi:hypothetical protein